MVIIDRARLVGREQSLDASTAQQPDKVSVVYNLGQQTFCPVVESCRCTHLIVSVSEVLSQQ